MPMVAPRAMTIAGLGKVTWIVAEVQPRSEKKLAADLLAAGHDYFLPLIKRVTVSHRRRRVHHVPIEGLGGYVFAASNELPYEGHHVGHDLHEFLIGHRAVFDLIEIHTAAQSAFVQELTTLHGAVMTGMFSDEKKMGPGTACRVKYGPFEGKQGRIDSIGKGWAILPITLLNRKICVEIPVSDLEPITDAALN
jgi:hypothetical protein